MDIRCPHCDTLWAKENEPGVLDMKVRDRYIRTRGGEVTSPCHRCGFWVTWPEVRTIRKVSE